MFFTEKGQFVQSQKEWIKADLDAANKNRAKVPWVIVFGHRPMYCSNDDGDDCTKKDSLVRLGYVYSHYHDKYCMRPMWLGRQALNYRLYKYILATIILKSENLCGDNGSVSSFDRN